jgi:glycerol-3-phosphate dehydrogenase
MIGGIGVKRCVTHDLMIHGSATVLAKDDPLAVYGSDAAEIRELMREKPSLAEKVHPKLELTAAEVVFNTRHEMARTPGDVLARRSRSLLFDAQASMSAAPSVAAIMAFELGWDAETTAHQVERFQKLACGYILEG